MTKFRTKILDTMSPFAPPKMQLISQNKLALATSRTHYRNQRVAPQMRKNHFARRGIICVGWSIWFQCLSILFYESHKTSWRKLSWNHRVGAVSVLPRDKKGWPARTGLGPQHQHTPTLFNTNLKTQLQKRPPPHFTYPQDWISTIFPSGSRK